MSVIGIFISVSSWGVGSSSCCLSLGVNVSVFGLSFDFSVSGWFTYMSVRKSISSNCFLGDNCADVSISQSFIGFGGGLAIGSDGRNFSVARLAWGGVVDHNSASGGLIAGFLLGDSHTIGVVGLDISHIMSMRNVSSFMNSDWGQRRRLRDDLGSDSLVF